ncbi:hypothetical protein P8C59_002979 [Phyllachora maydis]|uniref:Zinc/iron permease n=1 Tax=Phyllachora maydis TaxID=1825666 RepID=A0AAD9I0V0_9PEZI|nr:hypothetical protein P8C59_002979 [Phyllachora maydis]
MDDVAWSPLSTELLRAALGRRDDAAQPACGSGERGAYDTAIHVFALVLILMLSTLACAFPLFSRRSSAGGKKQSTVIFLCQHVGTGVLIATAFVHLLPTAFMSLTDPCLPHAFSKGYKPLAGLVAMVSALLVVALESFLTTRGAGHSHSPQFVMDDEEDLDELDPHVQELSPGPNGNGHSQSVPSGKRRVRRPSILFHSIFIGMALSVATGPTFAIFLVAIAFHQSFEGLALGSRIAAIKFPRSSPRPWLMVLAYGATTPIGQAIGLLVHNMYDPQSAAGLLIVGFMNAISSGMLLFAGLVQLLAEDFLTEKSYRALHGRKRVHAFIAVLVGAILMAGVGAFA